jgi:hypothetical protein
MSQTRILTKDKKVTKCATSNAKPDVKENATRDGKQDAKENDKRNRK